MLLAGAILASAAASAQTATKGGKSARKPPAVQERIPIAQEVLDAETALEKGDLARAEQLLLKAVANDAKDFRAWFNLGYVFNVTDRQADAREAYRKTVALKPTLQEANLNLGLLLAQSGDAEGAAKHLRAATTLKPDSSDKSGTYRAWLSLGRVLQKTSPQEASAAYREAAKLNPKDPEPQLSLAGLLEKSDPAGAETAFKEALALDPKSTDAMAGLINLYTQTNRLADAEALLRSYLQADPNNVNANLQLGRILGQSGKTEEALQHFEAGLKAKPQDRDLLQAVAAIYAQAKKYPQAEERYRALVQVAPGDAQLRRDFARVLTQLRRFPEAEAQFFEAIKLEPQHGDTYAEFAVVAAQNKKYELAIRALDERVKFVPESPGTYFLRATSYDNLKAYKEAAENYRRFLAAANGKFPDQEWQARHRLIAIDPDAEKKKK